MRIDIELNTKSIQQARKQLLYIKKAIPQIVNDFLEDVAMWIINRANEHLNVSDIGENVKIDIRNGWEIERTANGIKIINRTEKAVFVEFGVGQLGLQRPHHEAHIEGYQYNIGSKINIDDNTWIFNVTSRDDIDIGEQYRIVSDKHTGETSVRTKGQPAVMYAYNAIVDIQAGNTLKQLWEKSKRKYIK